MIRLKFNDTQSRDAFADRFKLDNKVDTAELDVGWHLLQFAKLDTNCIDYNEVAVLTAAPGANAEQEFIVKGDPVKFNGHATIVQHMGGGFYLVKSTDGTLLGDFVDSIEHTSAPVTYLATDCYIDEMNTVPTTLDPASTDAQWARLRVISKYRPLAKTFGIHDLTYQSKPELIVMDSGINFSHPEFDYPELEKEDFYTLPAFNGNFADDVGHGTAVASCAVGKNLGVASHVKLVNVKVGGQAHNATLLEIGSAIDAILSRITANPTVTRVVNMSWGIARSSWLDSKVQSLLDAGVTVVCAAGNQGISVEDISPAGLDSVITVGSIDKYDIPSGFNNISPSDAGVTTGHGLSLDIFAPGENVVIASYQGGYHIGSGTSFAAPCVAGIAVAMASLYSNLIPYSDLINILLDAATPDALLFEDDRFSENQNKLAFFPMSDSNINQKTTGVISYLGALKDDTTSIVADINSAFNIVDINKLFGSSVELSIKFDDPAQAEKYSPYVSIDANGIVTINYPRFEMPEDTKLVMVQFVVEATSTQVKATTAKLFFYDTNYNFKDTLESDITLALTDTNSISFYGFWGNIK
jgi:hypothetical protein